jgi:hypothetical protein
VLDSNNQSREDADQRSRPPLWRYWMIPFAIYIVPFVAIIIDERVLKTFWFLHHMPSGTGEVLRAMYPFYVVFK